MIELFSGEFLFHPAGIDISGNRCSHNCSYCFANIRKGDRVMDLKGVLNKFKINTQSILQQIISAKIPICISNKSDILSKNNYMYFKPIIEILKNNNIPIFIQTKTGENINEAIEILDGYDKKIWYITLTTMDESIKKKIEPDSPNVKDTMNAIEKLSRNNYVILAINPYVKEWVNIPAYKKFYNDVGVNEIIIEPLHFNKKELKNLTCQQIKSLTSKVLDRTKDYKNKRNLLDARAALHEFYDDGYNIFKIGMPLKDRALKDRINALGGNVMPSNWMFINDCIDNNEKKIYSVNDYINSIKKQTPKTLWDIRHKSIHNNYFLKYSFKEWQGNGKIQSIDNYEDIIKAHWNSKYSRATIGKNYAFLKVKDKKDGQGNNLVYYNKSININQREISYEEAIMDMDAS